MKSSNAAKALILLTLGAAGPLAAAAKGAYNEQERTLLRKISERTEMMRIEVGNHEEELRLVTEKLHNIEETLEELRAAVQLLEQSHREKVKGHETKLSTHESSLNGVVNDLRKLQSHANDSSSLINSYDAQIAQMDEVMQSQAKSVDDLRKAIKAVMEAIGASDGPIDSYRIYHVQPGDSLGLIAQKHNATIRELKDLNALKNDTIIVGQKLKIPER